MGISRSGGYLQAKIRKFEDHVGDIQTAAAAGTSWLSLKQAPGMKKAYFVRLRV